MPCVRLLARRILCGWMGLLCVAAGAQTNAVVRGVVQDAAGRPVEGASVVAEGAGSPSVKTVTDAQGRFVLDGARAGETMKAIGPEALGGMESEPVRVTAVPNSSEVELVLRPSAVAQQVTVTATRSSADLPATANTVYALGREQLQEYPAAALDDKLRQQAGFELYRRSTSRVQNPTSQGISLRGLGSTAVSRTLVLEDSVPMNDPFGGWIHWDEIPSDAVEAVTIATGGGSDLYGSSALGGVIDVVPGRAAKDEAGTQRLEASAFGGGQDTSSESVRGDAGAGRWSEMAAGDWFRTAGYVPTAPSAAGPVDVAANVHDEAARTETDRALGQSGRAFLVGNVLNEARGNGTQLTGNGTRLWRYIAGDDWSSGSKASGRARAFGSDEAYRQSFSSINAARTVETLTRLQQVRTQELGGSADATFALAPVALVVGADGRDIRATDYETPISKGVASGVADTSARQRFVGGFGEAVAAWKGWSGAVSLRLDSAENLDTETTTLPSTTLQPVATPDRGETIASPRFGVVRELGPRARVYASVFRAFRTPTMNELYRTGQVGAQVTEANAQLQSERATGWEAGAGYGSPRGVVAVEGTYFWTEINRPVSAVLLATNLYQRENLGQIVSQGTELRVELRQGRAVSAEVGYQYAHAVVTRFSAQPALVGNWIPEVPRQSVTAQLRAARAGLGEVTVAMRASGHAFDDSANTFVLGSFVEVDAAARHDFGARWTVSVTLQNLLNQRPDVAKTPTPALGSPFLAQAGLAFHWSRAAGH